MITSNPISTISYNSIEYLAKVLDQLYTSHRIVFYAWIYHYAEKNEKNHIHLFIIPDGRVDTSSLAEEFVEPVKGQLPFKCLPFYKSKFDDWYLYSCHDERYLASKGEYREYHYSIKNFVTSDDTYFADLIFKIDLFKFTNQERFIQAVAEGYSFAQCIKMKLVPLQQVRQYETYYSYLNDTTAGGSRGCVLDTPNNQQGN